MDKIKSIRAKEILDSRANPTVEVKITLESGIQAFASVPSGASTGVHEAHELRDNDKNRYNGKGVLTAVKNVNEIISPALVGRDVECWADDIMLSLDGSKTKENLGANAVLAVSLAIARAAAKSYGKELFEFLSRDKVYRMPTPMFNLLNGGAHANNNVDIQEFMVVPHGLDLPDAIRAGSEIYHTLGILLKNRGLSTGVGDEGGFAPNLNTDEEAIELLCMAISKSGYSTDKVGIALDVASSEWYKNGEYLLPKRGEKYTSNELTEYYSALIKKYPIISIEDGIGEDDLAGWSKLTAALGEKCMLVGDDLFVTNTQRLSMGIKHSAANAILIKPNQIGSLSQTMSVIDMARDVGYKYIISHRSGETLDSAISDIAVATKAEFIKAGAPARGERVAKYNRLLEILDMIS